MVRATTKRASSGSERGRPEVLRVSSRVPAWLDLPELATPRREIAPMLGCIDAARNESLAVAARNWLQRELAFIANPLFTCADAGGKIFANPLGLAPRSNSVPGTADRAKVETSAHFGRLCEAPLLSGDQERMLFQRMNFLLQQASAHRSLVNPSRPSRARLELIDRLVLLAHWHRDRLIEANLRLVFSIVKKFASPMHPFDDLLSEGIEALIRAVEKFDYDRGFRFSTYATQVVRRTLYQVIMQQQQERQRYVSGLEDMDHEFCEQDRSPALSDQRFYALKNRLRAMLSDLDRRERFIIRCRFSLGSHRRVHTLQSLADRLGVSKERVRQLEQRALQKLKTMADMSPAT